ncbi:double-strand break repair helicase AddA [Methylobacterium sp. C25]|uniref:double-strand break repair helicase AddA n=1 Tax=Methylobacterium sp. C25 TaxID=2721622 RepID=UPI001F2BCB23|nr:double-strand break repair helicase AddA [Methylobacterium sp. C25]MCE4223227.1 double-strand break repair helicase AddA [Methylobacterium sp. C25]
MSGRFVVDPLTQEAQRRAADPRVSAWVSANAGAGKTKVLTDRVLRLLLDGSPPGRILCLTFTKAAAANMSIRVFQRLGRWVTLDEKALSDELFDLSGRKASRGELSRARRLFARAVETPGGLKIETLHALCERLLHMFPFEANVPARFQVLDEDQTREAFAAQTDRVLADAILGRRPDLRMAFDVVGPEASGDALRDALRTAIRSRAFFADQGHALKEGLAGLGKALGLADGESADAIEEQILTGGPLGDEALVAGLRTGKVTDERLADGLVAAARANSRQEALDAYRAIFFTDEDKPRKGLGTKGVPEQVRQRLADEQTRLIPLFDTLRAANAHARTSALFLLASEIHRRVELEKGRLGALDFDDLIHKTLDLLRRVEVSWVLYKLDRGIDHVLVDEAQDTNPAQWEILRRITEEFASGEGARETLRTRFAVGDPKQSIYSFQGAEPREFEETRRDWRKASGNAGLDFEDVELRLSFRSTAGVLRAVDAVFALPEHFQGLSFADTAVGTVHGSARGPAPGAVELWPIAEPAEEPDADAWTAPVDAPEPNAPPILVARRVARAVRDWTTTGDACGRVWRPGDVLILVRKRSAAFEEVIRALKAFNVPVAGQDRLEVAGHIAVLDLVAIGRAGLLPADDLTLATALKTPLVGLTDDELVRIASQRPAEETLEDALLRHAAAGDEAAQRGHAKLGAWIALAAEQGPFGFYAALLGPLGGRKALVGRLGGEAGDAIDVFLAAAQAFEGGSDAPSLGAFLARYVARPGRGESSHTVKRDMESGRNEVRVMTVHGAKGLEAPVVVLIDGCEPLGRNDPALLPLATTAVPPVWIAGRIQDCAATTEARATLHARAREEHNRLLYVAMTRAADHLVVAPYRGATLETPASWCEMVRIGLERGLGPGEPMETGYGPVTLWRDGLAGIAPSDEANATVEANAAVPGWLRRPAEAESQPAPPVSPSGALAAADGRRDPGRREAAAEARRRGKLIHSLMEHLPRLAPEKRAEAAARFVTARAPSMPSPKRGALVAACLQLLDEPDLAPLFASDARAEVTLAGSVVFGDQERRVFGRVDRLALDGDRVLVCDFKTGRPPAENAPLPATEAAQIALYAALLERIYPGREVVPMLVWTSGPVLRRLDHSEIVAALATVGFETA